MNTAEQLWSTLSSAERKHLMDIAVLGAMRGVANAPKLVQLVAPDVLAAMFVDLSRKFMSIIAENHDMQVLWAEQALKLAPYMTEADAQFCGETVEKWA